MSTLPATLRGRMLVAMVAFAFAGCTVMALLVVAFAYGIEDAGFNQQLARESARQMAGRATGGGWAAPADPAMRVVNHHDLPRGLSALLAHEPGRVEYTAPSGRHYHFVPLASDGESSAWLLYDVTERLIVRPSALAIWGVLAFVTLLMLSAGAALALWLSRRVTHPLSELVQAVQQTDPGSLDWRVPAAREPAEVAVLGARLDSLLARLRAFVDRERAFTRDASHEIRTPLAVARLRLDHLLQLPELSPSIREALSDLHDAIDDLQRIVQTLIWLAREEAMPSFAESALLRPLIERAIVDQSPRLDGRTPHVAVDIPVEARLSAPPGALLLIVGNLIGNAFTHAGPGPITIDWDGEGLHIRNSRERAAGGSAVREAGRVGFGLSIVQRVAERSGLAVDIRAGDDQFAVRVAPAPLSES